MENAIALGTFDGVHAGHRAVLDAVLPYFSVAVTFAVPPKMAMIGKGGLIMPPENKYRALTDYGIQKTDILDFDSVRNFAPNEFLNQLAEKYHPARIACGYNYRFGKNAAGDTAFLKEFCLRNHIDFFCADPVTVSGTPLSSTLLRQWIVAGEMEKANAQIPNGFGFSAPIIHGDGRGRNFGVATVNQRFPQELVCPKNGVYLSLVEMNGNRYPAVTNIGKRPTYPTDEIFAETHLLRFSGNLYGQTVCIRPLRFLREEQKFATANDLVHAVRQDIATAEQFFSFTTPEL